MDSPVIRLCFGWLLNLAYLAVLFAASPWIVWTALRVGKYREGFAAKLFGRVPRRIGNAPCIWLHAVSVGEVNLLATIIDVLSERAPEFEIVISTTTKTGYDLAAKKYRHLAVFYCPLDFTWATREAMRRIRPELLVLAELELWPNLIAAAKASGAMVAVVNGRLSPNSFRGYRRIRPVVARVLRWVDLIAVQDDEIACRFRALGAPEATVQVTGSLKFDGVETDRGNSRTENFRRLAKIGPDEVVLLAGSTQDPEEEIVLRVYHRLVRELRQLRLILVPRHPERFAEVGRLLDASPHGCQRRSELTAATAEGVDRPVDGLVGEPSSEDNVSPARPIVLVDTIGELSHWWGVADIAFVGGSFGDRGGQNMLEPAAYGAAVCFGPNTRNFRDIVARLLDADGARMTPDEAALEAFIRRAVVDGPWSAALGRRARRLVLAQQGAAARTATLLLECRGVATAVSRHAA